jgi:hypothetical protein
MIWDLPKMVLLEYLRPHVRKLISYSFQYGEL